MKTRRLNLADHPTLFDLTPYPLIQTAKRAARKAVDTAKTVVKKVAKKVKKFDLSDHPLLFDLNAFTKKAVTAVKVAVTSPKKAQVQEEEGNFYSLFHPGQVPDADGLKLLGEAVITDAFCDLKALNRARHPEKKELKALETFFLTDLEDFLTLYGFNLPAAAISSIQEKAVQLIEAIEERLLVHAQAA